MELFLAVIAHCHSMEHYIDPTTVPIRGCYHLTQTTWRKIQELGLIRRNSTDKEFNLFCGQVDALARLPVEHITIITAYLRENTPEFTGQDLY